MENELPQDTTENTQISSEEKIREMKPWEMAFFGLVFISAIGFGIYKIFGKRTTIALAILFVWSWGSMYIGLSQYSSNDMRKNDEYILYLVLFVIFYVLYKYLK